MRAAMLWFLGYEEPYAAPTAQAAESVLEYATRAAARALSDRVAEMCNVDKEDHWQDHSDDVLSDAELVISTAGAITPPPIECDTDDLKRAYAFGWWSALEKQRETAQAGAVGKAVHQFRKKHCADWYDGFADHSDGGGPYEERTLYTAGAVPLTDEQWQRITDLTGGRILTQGVKDEIERVIGIKGGQHGTE